MSRCKLFLLITCLSVSCASADSQSSVHQAWNSGKAVVVVINADETSSSEQYADWSYYLHAFSEEHAGAYQFISLDVVNKVDIPKDMQKPYALLFFKKGEPSYLSSAPILEPQV